MTMSAAMPIGTLTKKIARPVTQCTMTPPTVGPSNGAISAGMTTKFIAARSSDFGNVRTTARRPTGVIIAPASPCPMRPATSMGTLIDNPQADRCQREQRDCCTEHVARAKAIGNPAADGNANGQTYDVARHDGLQAEGR